MTEVKRDIINKIYILMHKVDIQYMTSLPSTKILKPETNLERVIKLHDVNLFKTIPNKKRLVLNCTRIQWPYWKLIVTKVSNPSTE